MQMSQQKQKQEHQVMRFLTLEEFFLSENAVDLGYHYHTCKKELGCICKEIENKDYIHNSIYILLGKQPYSWRYSMIAFDFWHTIAQTYELNATDATFQTAIDATKIAIQEANGFLILSRQNTHLYVDINLSKDDYLNFFKIFQSLIDKK
jgi:hypothetical protein